MEENSFAFVTQEFIEAEEKKYNDRAIKWLALLQEVPKEDQPQWIKETLRDKKNLYIFGRYFFSHIIKSTPPYAHHLLIQEISNPNTSAVIFPRGHAKSTWIKIDTLHDIVYNIENVIVYVSDVLRNAKTQFEAMRSELENNELLRAVYGDLVPPMKQRESTKWTDTHFETMNGVNVVARGAGKGRGVNIKNERPSKVIMDDIEDDEQVQSLYRRQKLHDWVFNVILPSLSQERAKIKWIGTIIHAESELLKFYKQYGGLFLPATYNGRLNNESIPVWKAMFPIVKLIQIKKEIGSRSFNQEYMHNPTSFDLARLKPEWIDNNIFTVLPTMQKQQPNIVIAMDVQGGEKVESDEYAITVLAYYDKDPHRYVIDQRAGRASQLQQAAELINTWSDHPTAKVVAVEKILNQVAVFQLVQQWKTGRLENEYVNQNINNRNIPIRSIVPNGKTGGVLKNKIVRFEMHEAMIERGELHIRPEMQELREQLLFFGTDAIEHDDRADSVIMALDLSYKMAHSGEEDYDGFGVGGRSVTGNLWREKF